MLWRLSIDIQTIIEVMVPDEEGNGALVSKKAS